jgi:hypothetical protein
VSVTFARLDELQVHRARGLEILAHHRLQRSSAVADVAANPPEKP